MLTIEWAADVETTRQHRIVTGLALGVAVIVLIFAAPSEVFFVVSLTIGLWAGVELVRIWRFWTPGAPLSAFMVLMPATAVGLAYAARFDTLPPLVVLGIPAAIVFAAGIVVLWSDVPLPEGAVAVGFLSFGVPYFALPMASLYELHRIDPWLVLVLAALVALGDTAAYFVGSWIGRHRLAPRVSPKKSWEGAIAGGVMAVATMAAWCLLRYGEVRPAWLALAAVTAATAQLGDLLESLVKRGAGVKDSSNVLPGHGGVLDRVDAMLLAAPVFLLGLWALGLEAR